MMYETFRPFDSVLRFYVGYTDGEGVSAWVRRIALH